MKVKSYWYQNLFDAIMICEILCGANSSENVVKLWVSCDNRNNDRAPSAYFTKYPRAQGEWLCQTQTTPVESRSLSP